MSKKIVIIPTFCDAHIIKYQIPNIIETINPDYIIYNEGRFPAGPESNTNVTAEFLKEYTLDGWRGFDFEELTQIIEENQKKYSDTTIILNKMKYPVETTSAIDCFTLACTNFKELGIDIEKGDYIFPYEADVFHHESTKDEIEGYMVQLEPDTGFKTIWLDFMETQYYVEKKTTPPLTNGGSGGRQRRVCVRYGTMEFLKGVLSNFMTQQYPMLYPTELVTFHYPWIKPGKYKELRFALINRDESYWAHFNMVLNKIREHGNETKDDILLRPNLPLDRLSRYVSFIDIEHPTCMLSHQSFIK